MTPIKGILAATLLPLIFSVGHAEELPACMMAPEYDSIQFPDKGLIELFEREMETPCDNVPADAWTVKSTKQGILFVHAAGPSGSGRYWTVTIGIGDNKEQPARGFCLRTSTIGWRTLQRYKTPLQWISDRDGDDISELTIWDSFPLSRDEMPDGFAIIAWVYRLDEHKTLMLDQPLSKELALDIAKSYRIELDKGEALKGLRGRAADALEAFGRGECKVRLPEGEE